MARCFFIGHRDAPETVKQQLEEVVLRLVDTGNVKEFLVGRYGKFDSMAAEAVLAVKQKRCDIRLILLMPYHPGAYRQALPDGFDEILYPFEKSVPPRFAIARANEKAIRSSSHLIAYVRYPGKSRAFLEYAQKREGKNELKIELL